MLLSRFRLGAPEENQTKWRIPTHQIVYSTPMWRLDGLARGATFLEKRDSRFQKIYKNQRSRSLMHEVELKPGCASLIGGSSPLLDRLIERRHGEIGDPTA